MRMDRPEDNTASASPPARGDHVRADNNSAIRERSTRRTATTVGEGPTREGVSPCRHHQPTAKTTQHTTPIHQPPPPKQRASLCSLLRVGAGSIASSRLYCGKSIFVDIAHEETRLVDTLTYGSHYILRLLSRQASRLSWLRSHHLGEPPWAHGLYLIGTYVYHYNFFEGSVA